MCARACMQKPTTWPRRDGVCFFVLTNMSPLMQNEPMHTKSKDQKHTRKILCAWSPCQQARQNWIQKHANKTRTCAVNSDARSQLHAPTDAAAPGRAFPASRQAFCSAVIDNTLTVITQTHQTKRTKHALNARHRVAASNAGIMRASPRLTPHVLYTARAPTVWMGRTCKRSQGWRSVLPVRMQTRSGLMVVVCPPVIVLQTPPVAAPAGRAFTSTTLTFHHSESVVLLSCWKGTCCKWQHE